MVDDMRAKDVVSVRAVADELNARGILTVACGVRPPPLGCCHGSLDRPPTTPIPPVRAAIPHIHPPKNPPTNFGFDFPGSILRESCCKYIPRAFAVLCAGGIINV
jgi:hypothetical protein